MISLDISFEEKGKIGSPGVVVEIDECKIGRRKYEWGRMVKGSWILGIIVIGESEKHRIGNCLNNKRDKNTLISLIRKHVASGTEIYTDLWKGYFNLHDHGYKHVTVNHS